MWDNVPQKLILYVGHCPTKNWTWIVISVNASITEMNLTAQQSFQASEQSWLYTSSYCMNACDIMAQASLTQTIYNEQRKMII